MSAVIVACNQIEPLRRAVAALERSTDRERLEILVVDLASTDGCAQIDSEFPSVVPLRLPHNFGATKAMNVGTRTAKAELVFYLSPDVEVEPDTVRLLADKLEADNDASAVCPLLVDENGKPVSRVFEIPTAATLKGEMPVVALDLSKERIDVEYPGRDAILVRKQFVRGMNYFDDRFGEYWADADLATQIYRGLKKIRLYPSIRAVRRGNSSADSSKGLLAADRAGGAAAFLGKHYGFFSGLSFRIGAILSASAHFDLKQLFALLSGQKIDGSQAV
ncbi:MAG TPA: glycosyltransferase [Dongiaceae bacterium]|nr:glycosyltransferase [Dongiaceae bacterium]